MHPRLVSVLLPVRDGADTVGRAIASIRRQTWEDWELVVVDDGSTDATPEILAQLAREDARIHILTRPRQGVVAALNAGLLVARGSLLARMDADDESHPERLAAQREGFAVDRHGELGVVGCLVAFGGDRDRHAGYALHVDWSNALVTPEAIALNRFVESPLAHPSVMFRADLVQRLGGYRDGAFPEDYELWLRWLDAGVAMAKVPRVLLTWHDAPQRLSRTDPRYAPEAFFRVKAEFVAREVARWQSAKSRDAADHSAAAAASNASSSGARPVYVWGAGRHTRKRAGYLAQHGLTIAGYVDVDVKKTGRGIGGTGLPVLSPEDLPPAGKIIVLGYVTTRGAREFIRTALGARGYVEGRDFLMCA